MQQVSAVCKFHFQLHFVLFLISLFENLSFKQLLVKNSYSFHTRSSIFKNIIVTAWKYCKTLSTMEKLEMENRWYRILTMMVDTQIIAYSDQYYFTRQDITSYEITILQLSSLQEISALFLQALDIKKYIQFTDPIQRIQSSFHQQTSPKFKATTTHQNRQ
jgi:hypothetical protein